MATKKATENEKKITVNLNLKTISVPIIGETELIMNRFSEKAGQQIKEIAEAERGLKQGGKKKNISDPESAYQNSFYRFADGETYGFPATGFKDAMVTAAYRSYNRPQTVTRSAFHVIADDPFTGLVKINGTPRMREDMVRVGTINKVASPRYRAGFPEWSAVVTIQFMADVITEEEIVGILNAAGYNCGIGEWRPEKSNSGWAGRWKVASTE